MNTLNNLNIAALITATLQGGLPPAYLAASIAEPPTNAPGPQLTIGNASGQVNQVYAAAFSVAGTPLTINVGNCTDPLGGNVAMVHVAIVEIVNTSSTGNLTLGGGTNPVMGSDVATIQPGGVTLKINAAPGYAVVTSASDTITITASAGTVTGRITILGRNA